MYRFLLFRDGLQIYSSNSRLNVLSWRGDDKCFHPDARYMIIDQVNKPGFRQALH